MSKISSTSSQDTIKELCKRTCLLTTLKEGLFALDSNFKSNL